MKNLLLFGSFAAVLTLGAMARANGEEKCDCAGAECNCQVIKGRVMANIELTQSTKKGVDRANNKLDKIDDKLDKLAAATTVVQPPAPVPEQSAEAAGLNKDMADMKKDANKISKDIITQLVPKPDGLKGICNQGTTLNFYQSTGNQDSPGNETVIQCKELSTSGVSSEYDTAEARLRARRAAEKSDSHGNPWLAIGTVVVMTVVGGVAGYALGVGVFPDTITANEQPPANGASQGKVVFDHVPGGSAWLTLFGAAIGGGIGVLAGGLFYGLGVGGE